MAIERIATFNLAGVTFENRQANIVEYIECGRELALVREPDNQWDSNAIKVIGTAYHPHGTTELDLGYVPREHAEYLAPALDAGKEYRVILEKIYEYKSFSTFGVRVSVLKD